MGGHSMTNSSDIITQKYSALGKQTYFRPGVGGSIARRGNTLILG